MPSMVNSWAAVTAAQSSTPSILSRMASRTCSVRSQIPTDVCTRVAAFSSAVDVGGGVGVLVGVDAAIETGVCVGVLVGTDSDVGVNVPSGVGVLVGCVTVVEAGLSSHADRTTASRQSKPTQANPCMVLRDVICNLSSPMMWALYYYVPPMINRARIPAGPVLLSSSASLAVYFSS